MLKLLQRYLKYAGTSVAGTLVDTLVLWLMSDFVFRDVYWGQYIVSPVISFQCAVITNYLIFYFYVWRDRTKEDRRRHNFIRRFLAYDVSCSTVFLLRLGILLLVEKFSGWDVVVCNLIAMCFSGILNFVSNNLIIFRKNSGI
jgi:putative flippase GtrA